MATDEEPLMLLVFLVDVDLNDAWTPAYLPADSQESGSRPSAATWWFGFMLEMRNEFAAVLLAMLEVGLRRGRYL